MTCPYRIAPEHGCAQAASVSGDTLLSAVQRRELRGRSAALSCRNVFVNLQGFAHLALTALEVLKLMIALFMLYPRSTSVVDACT